MYQQIKMLIRASHYKNRENPNEINFIRKNLKSGHIAIDIGANKGGFLYWMIKSVGSKGKVVAFEPQEYLYQFLKSFYSAKKFSQVTIESFALSDKSDSVTMIIPENGKKSSPGASIHFTLNENPTARTEKVFTVSLDDYCEQNALKPSLIKIDVEGHELKVIKGGINTFAKYKPKIILECESGQVGKQAAMETFTHLLEIGYKGFFYYKKTFVDFRDFDFSIHQPDSFTGKKGEVYVSNFFFE